MKMKMFGVGAVLVRRLGLPTGLLLCQTLLAAVTFTNTPTAVSNTYNGSITLQIGGLTNTETVVIQKFLDLNTNGVIDGNDWLAQQFQMTDGQAGMAIGGVTNFNVPGDLNATTGAITATLNFKNGDFMQNMVGKFLLKLSSPVGHFTPITNSFIVTNFPYAQKITGTVVSNGVVVPNASVLLFIPNHGPIAGAIANNSGSYAIAVPAGTYSLMAFKSNYVANYGAAPVVTLTNTQTITTNLTVTNATVSISGKVVDANNSSIGLPGVLLSAQADNGWMGVGFTDTNGNFTVGVNSGQWHIGANDTSLIVHGYPGLDSRITVDTTTGSVANVTIALPKATALFYGNVSDTLGNPLSGIDVYAEDYGNHQYETDGYTDTNGNYFAAVPAGDWNVSVSEDSNPTNYIFPRGQGQTLTNGQVVQWNFTALLATNHIAGSLKDNNNNPISGVGINANATINGTNYQAYEKTDANGQYSFNVANGTWTVNVNSGCSDCSDDLPDNYLAPGSQTIGITNSNGTANFIALIPSNHITGMVKDNNGDNIAGVGINANATINGTNYHAQADTDNSGNYTLNVVNGNWSVSVFCCCGNDSLNNLGNYACPNGQIITIFNHNALANFTVQTNINVGGPLQVTTVALPNGAVGAAYDQQLTADGGQPSPSYGWSVFSGSLPPGLSMDVGGTIQGTPTLSSTNNFTVQVSDNNGSTATQALSLTINNGVLQVMTTSLSSGTTNVAYNSQQLTASGGQPPYNWSLASGVLPPGLSLSTNGVISGTPTTAGTSNFVVQVTDSALATATQALSLAVYKFSTSVTFMVTPPAVSNFYTGIITLQVGGLASGETVLVEKFRDVNGNGVIDVGETEVQQFQLTDGQASVFYDGTTAVTNFNVPGDLTPADGAITAQLYPAISGVSQLTVAQYAFRLSSPVGHFAPITNLFNVTNSAYAQSFTGNVVCSGTNVPHAMAYLLTPLPRMNIIAATLADDEGGYRLNAPPGTYLLWAFKNGFVADAGNGPVLALGANATITTNLSLLPATRSISGKVVDAANTNAGLPRVNMTASTTNYLITIGWTDGDGNFALPATANGWAVYGNSQALDSQGLLGLQSRTRVNTTTGSVAGVTIALARGTALVYGAVQDAQNHPLASVRLSGNQNDGTGPYVGDATTDADGNYAMAVNDAGMWNASINGNNPAFPNYVWSAGLGDTTFANGQAVQWNFTALLATNHITGNIQVGGTNIAGVGVWASMTTNSADFFQYVDTDTNGNYSLNVGNGNWNIGVNCTDGDDSLDNILGSGNYACPNSQNVNIAGNNATNNFTVQLCGGISIVTSSPLPTGEVNAYYDQFLQASSCSPDFTWSLISGSLPPGLTGNPANGEIYGTPTNAGTFNFTIQVTDGENTTSKQFSLTISNSLPDVLAYYVTKLETFQQLDATNIILNTNAGPFTAFLGIVQSALGAVPIATVTLPTGAVKGLPWGSSAIEMRSQESFASQGSFDAAYPPGSYAFGLYGLHDGLRFPVLSMPPPVYPNPPRVSNFAAAQSLNPLAAFTLQWDAIPGGTTNDTLWVFITDTNGNPVFSTPYPPMDLAGSLKGTATSVVIPTNTFQSGHAYVGTITFFRMTSVNTTGYPGAVGATVVGVQTWFPLAMVSAPGITITESCPSGPVSAGSAVPFGGLVSNTGNITLTNILVFSGQPGNPLVLGPITLAPGASALFAGSYIATGGSNPTTNSIIVTNGIGTITTNVVSVITTNNTVTVTTNPPTPVWFGTINSLSQAVVDRFVVGTNFNGLTCAGAAFYSMHNIAGEHFFDRIIASTATNTDLFNATLASQNFDALAYAFPDVGYGSNLFYYVRSGNAVPGSLFGTINLGVGVITDRFVTTNYFDFDALTFTATDVGYGASMFYYVRHDATGLSIFGTINTAWPGTCTDRFTIGTNVDALVFTDLTAPGYGATNFYYLRHNASGVSTFGTIHVTGQTTATVTDRFTVGTNATELTFTATDVAYGPNLFYFLRSGDLGLATNIVTTFTTNTVTTYTTNSVVSFTTNSVVSFTTTNTVTATGMDIGQSRIVAAAANCLGPVAPATPVPVIGAPTMANGIFSLSFSTENGKSYTVQYKNALNDPTWTDLETVIGTGGTLTITDATAAQQPRRFYRVMATP